MFERVTQGAVDVIQGTAPLNAEQVEQLNDLFHQCLSNGQPSVVLNLDKVSLIDSAGLELLLDVQDDCRRHGGAVKIAAPNALCREILEVTGVDRAFEVFPEPLAAVGSFAR